jgi:hypothetical protein
MNKKIQRIICRDGRCVDINQLNCSEIYTDIKDIIECELGFKKDLNSK